MIDRSPKAPPWACTSVCSVHVHVVQNPVFLKSALATSGETQRRQDLSYFVIHRVLEQVWTGFFRYLCIALTLSLCLPIQSKHHGGCSKPGIVLARGGSFSLLWLQKQALTRSAGISENSDKILAVRKAVVTSLSSLLQPCGLVTIKLDGLLTHDLNHKDFDPTSHDSRNLYQ